MAERGPELRGSGAILAVVWLCSLGTAVAWQGVFFIAREQYAFDETRRYLLAVAGGAAYVVAALLAGRAVRLLMRNARVRQRGFLVGVQIGACAVSGVAGALPKEWTLWLFMTLYALLTGCMWPLLESYVSSGRSGRDLVRAVGRFNIAWATAIPVSLWAMAPTLEQRPLATFYALAIIHLVCVPIIGGFAPSPAPHGEPELGPDAPDRRAAARLLVVFRVLNAGSYVLVSLLLPALPGAMESMGIPVGWRTPLVSTWVLVRIGMFVLLERWHGWHGRWRTPVWSCLALAIGFGLAYAASGPAMLVLGLALFGIGAGGAYTGALYYAMDVGSAEVDAGGKHEAVLGAGYLVGPVIGLLVVLL